MGSREGEVQEVGKFSVTMALIQEVFPGVKKMTVWFPPEERAGHYIELSFRDDEKAKTTEDKRRQKK